MTAEAQAHFDIQQQAFQVLAGITEQSLEMKLKILQEAQWMLQALQRAERERIVAPPLRVVQNP